MLKLKFHVILLCVLITFHHVFSECALACDYGLAGYFDEVKVYLVSLQRNGNYYGAKTVNSEIDNTTRTLLGME